MSWVAAAPGRSSLVEEAPTVAATPGKQTLSEPRGLAKRTMAELTEASSARPVHAVTADGDPVRLRKRLEDAIAARSAAGVLAAVRDMDTASRKDLASQLLALDFITARDLLVIAGWAEAEPAQAVIAALQATPPLTRAQARAYLSSLTAYRVREAFSDDALATALRTKLGGSPIDLLPQVADDVALFGASLLAWLIEASPPKLVARVLLGLSPSAVEMQCDALDALGERGWAWLAAVDATIAAASAPGTLAAYRARAHHDASEDGAATEHEHRLARWESVAAKPAKRGEAAALRARRAQIIARSPVLEIQAQAQRAGLSVDEQFAWVLDKPGLTAAQLREATLMIETSRLMFDDALVGKLRRLFPGVPVEQLFSGPVPRDLREMAVMKRPVAAWLLEGAEPEAILRIVAADAITIASWCKILDELGIGYGWVRQLGGNIDEPLLRRFALCCPDAATRDYLEARVIGTGKLAGSAETTTSPDLAASATAYTSARSHLDADLDAKAAPGVAAQSRAAALSADVLELTAVELERLRLDVHRLEQILATASAKTFAMIVERIQPPLALVVTYLPAKDVIPIAQMIAAMQGRSSQELIATLSTKKLVERMAARFGKRGPLEVFPSCLAPAVLASVLRANPSFIEWLLDSEPSAVISALGAPSSSMSLRRPCHRSMSNSALVGQALLRFRCTRARH